VTVAIGPGSFDEAVNLGVGQILTRPHFGVTCSLGRSAALHCPNNSGWCDQQGVILPLIFGLFPAICPLNDPSWDSGQGQESQQIPREMPCKRQARVGYGTPLTDILARRLVPKRRAGGVP
jgi:hypothetical protein